MDQMLLYVSTRTAEPDDRDEIAAIVAVARSRNAALDVTGALLATARHFAQILEGRPEAIAALMDSIRDDPRHRNVRVRQTADIARRRFATWSLVYSGPSHHLEQFVIPLAGDQGGTNHDIHRLIDLIARLAGPASTAMFDRASSW